MASSRFRHAGRWLALAAVPCLLLALASVARIPVPGNAQHEDPDWFYIANSAALADGKGVHLMQHPGIPVAVGGAIFLRLKAALAPESAGLPFAEEVLLHTPAYHWYLGNVLLGLTALAVLGFGFVLARRLPLGLAVACQLLLVLTPMHLEFAGRWIPEGFAVLFGAVTGALLFSLSAPAPRWWLLPVTGALAGLAVCLKLNYAPYLLFAFARGWKKAPLALVASALAFAAFLLALRDGWSERMFRYFFWMATRKGMYASGEPGMPDLAANLARLYGSHPFLIWQLVCLVLFSGLTLALVFRKRGGHSRTVVLLLFAAIVLNLIGQAKHPAARYSLPALVLFPALLALVWAAAGSLRARAITAVCALLTVATGARAWVADLSFLREQAARVGAQEAEIEARLTARPECLQIFHNAVPSHRWANFTASLWSGYQLDEQYRRAFPRTWEYDVHRELFRAHGRERIVAEGFLPILKEAPCAFFYQRRDLPNPLQAEAFRVRKWVSVFRTPQAELHLTE